MVNSRNRGNESEDSGYWGVLNKRNIRSVVFGNYQFDTWYGNGAYFHGADIGHTCLGYEFSNKMVANPSSKPKKKITNEQDQFWLDTLYVCQYCFKYTASGPEMSRHRSICQYNLEKPIIGKLVYYDKSNIIIRQIRGFENSLFCQNLALFGKLFLDDKSIYYNIDHYDFFVIYSKDENFDDNFKPMGFFSKEVVSWDNDNNLACICIFPPYQRRHLGWLLIEFLYALAHQTPGQLLSGPEFPLSPYGRLSYYRFWSIKLAHILSTQLNRKKSFTLNDLSEISGFRKEDILLALEYMQLLTKDCNDNVKLMLGNLQKFCEKNKIDPYNPRDVLNKNYLLI